MNWKRGLLRVWVVLSVIWVIAMLALGVATDSFQNSSQSGAVIVGLMVIPPTVALALLYASFWAFSGFGASPEGSSVAPPIKPNWRIGAPVLGFVLLGGHALLTDAPGAHNSAEHVAQAFGAGTVGALIAFGIVWLASRPPRQRQ
jgi:hypothetical protein